MGKTVLITGSESLLGRKLIEKNLSEGKQVIAPVISSSEEIGESQKNKLLVLPWNQSSVISARTVVREAIRIFHKIDEVILVHSENKTNDQLVDFLTSDIDDAIDNSLKGTVYLTKELLKVLGEGNSLSFVVTNKGDGENSLDRGINGFFKSFADGQIKRRSPFYQCAFTTSLSDMEGYAEFINRLREERPLKGEGQWFAYSDRKNLFSSLPIIQRKQDTI